MPLSLKRVPLYPPREPRAVADIDAALFLPDDRAVPARVANLSPRGFMAEIEEPVAPGTGLGLFLPRYGIIRARVRWCDEEGRIGCETDLPIDPDKLNPDE
jgi:hypothetical protein